MLICIHSYLVHHCFLQVAFLASALGPRVAAACAHESLASLSKESDKEGTPGGIKCSDKNLT